MSPGWDKLAKKIKEYKCSGRVRAYRRIYANINPKIRDCHCKLAKFLCENYRAILIPKFDVSKMIRRRNRKRYVRRHVEPLQVQADFEGQEAEFYPWTTVAIVNEAYTSKTCDECGHIRPTFSGKVFKCPKCENVADRDIPA